MVSYRGTTSQKYPSRFPRSNGGRGPGPRASTFWREMQSRLGLDVVAAAIGLDQATLRDIAAGNASVLASHQAHLAFRLKAAGIPPLVVDGISPPTDEHAEALFRLAAQSKNQAPLRRRNFLQLTKAFSGRLDILADALDMNPASVADVADGQLLLDDQRFSHINPRLMQAGLPNGWLEMVNPPLSAEDIDRLTRQAEISDDIEYGPTNVQETMNVAQAQSQFHGDPWGDPVEAAASPAAAAPILVSSPAVAPPTPAKPAVSEIPPSPKVNSMPKKQKQSPASSSTPNPVGNVSLSALRRAARPGVPASAQGLGGAPLRAPGGAKPPVARTAPVTSPLAAPLTPPPSVATPSAAVAPSAPKGMSMGDMINRQQAAATAAGQSAERNTALQRSIARATALDTLLSTARRGAKVTLWRDMLGSSLPYAGSIRRGVAIMREDMAQKIEQCLELPQGWLDNPSFPPAHIARWVTDADVPLPTADAQAPAPAPTPAAPAIASAPLKSPLRMPHQPAAQPTIAPAAPQAAAKAPVAAAPAPVAAAPVQQVPAVAKVQTSPLASQTPNAATALLSAGPSFEWIPSADPQAKPAATPLAQALGNLITHLSVTGKMTDDDALRLMTYLMSR